jgi:multidrug resistance efflux pump
LETRIQQESVDVESAKSDAEAALTAHQIQEKDNESKLEAAQVKLTLAELALSQWIEGEKVQKEKDNTQAIQKAKDEKERLQEKYEKSVKLQEQGFLSSDQLKQDKLAFEEADRALDKANLAQAIYEKYGIPHDRTSKQSDVDQATADLERTKAQNEIQIKSKASALETKKSQLAIKQASLDKLKKQLEASTITAPTDGLVVYATSMQRMMWGGMMGEGPMAIGRQVYPNELIMVLPDTSEMVASVQVHEALASKIKPGLAATVKVDAAGGKTYSGKVASIGVLAESGGWRDPNLREYTVKIALDTGGAGVGALKPSMRCESEIVMGKVDDAATVPIQSVFNEGMLRYVYTLEGGKYTKRPVKLGRLSEKFAEIGAGLNIGEKVLLREPKAGEVLSRPFTPTELAAVDLKFDAEGKIVAANPGKGGTGGAPPEAPAGAAVVVKSSVTPVVTVADKAKPAEKPAEEAAPAEPATDTKKDAVKDGASTTVAPKDKVAEARPAPAKKSAGG